MSTDGKTFSIGADGQGAILETIGALVQLSGDFNEDPSISYDVTVTDFDAPSTFVFTFITPIAATGAPNEVDASLAGALTDSGGDGVSLVPIGGALVQISSLGDPPMDMGVDIGGSLSAPADGISNSFSIYGPFDSDIIPGPGPGPWTSLSVVTSFTLSGNDDIAALSGSAEIVQVPTPNLSFPAGLFLLGMMHRRARSCRHI